METRAALALEKFGRNKPNLVFARKHSNYEEPLLIVGFHTTSRTYPIAIGSCAQWWRNIAKNEPLHQMDGSY